MLLETFVSLFRSACCLEEGVFGTEFGEGWGRLDYLVYASAAPCNAGRVQKSI